MMRLGHLRRAGFERRLIRATPMLSWTLANFRCSETAALQVFLMPAGIFARSRARPGPTKNSVYPYILGHFRIRLFENWPKSSSDDRIFELQILGLLPKKADVALVKSLRLKHGELVAEALLLDETHMAVGEEKIARLRRDLNRVRLELASHCAGVGIRLRQFRQRAFRR